MDTQIQVVDRLRSAFNSGITIPEQFRQTQLTKLLSLIKENEELILNALHRDLAKVQDFTQLYSMLIVKLMNLLMKLVRKTSKSKIC